MVFALAYIAEIRTLFAGLGINELASVAF